MPVIVRTAEADVLAPRDDCLRHDFVAAEMTGAQVPEGESLANPQADFRLPTDPEVEENPEGGQAAEVSTCGNRADLLAAGRLLRVKLRHSPHAGDEPASGHAGT